MGRKSTKRTSTRTRTGTGTPPPGGRKPPAAEGAAPFDLPARAASLLAAFFVVAAFAVRLALWLEFKASDIRALLVLESMDSLKFHHWAERIAGGDLLLGHGLFTLSPFYSYLLAPIYAVTGSSMFAAILVQLLLGAGAVFLMYRAGALLFGRLAGVVAAGMAAFYGQFVLTEGLLLSEAFVPFLTALFVWWTARSLKAGKGAKAFILSGLLLGALFSIRPQYFLAVALLPLCGLLWAWRRDRRAGSNGGAGGGALGKAAAGAGSGAAGGGAAPASAAASGGAQTGALRATVRIFAFGALGAALAVAPLFARNILAAGRPVLLTAAGGANFYIGNNAEAKGTWAVPRGFRLTQSGMFEDFARAAGRKTYDDACSRYWFRKTLAAIAGDPGRWARLMLHKAGLFWNNREIPVNFDFDFLKKNLGAVRFAFIPFAAAGSLGLLGLFLAFREKRALWLAVIVVGYFLGTILFFVAARYRVAVVPYLLLFAGYGLARLAALVHERAWAPLAGWSAAGAAALALTLLPLYPGVHPACRAHQLHSMGIYYLREKKDPGRAAKWIRESLLVDRSDPVAWGDLGMILFKAQHFRDAEKCIRQALEGLPDNSALWGVLGKILEKTGRPEEARKAFAKSKEAGR